ncbi:MAG: TonB-dependent receptor, partial [Acidobacteriota bacterium]|nr:TonB-dependent receptor [Acidobacteriota bacterium]
MQRLIATGFAAAIATAALGTTTVLAQEAGGVRGTVTLEENGEPVHGAVILVVGSGAFALTDEQGMFEIDNIPAGSYEVLAQREHLTAGRQTVTVDPGGAATVDFVLGLSPVHEDVTVTASVGGTETTFEAFNAVTTLDSFDITRESAGSLGDALRNEPGVASRSFGPGSSRPIIRGFDGDRVLILEDGLRTGDLSSQSGDHGVTIDPNGAERIEIVRGPATLLYGSNAVGGLVNVITPHESYRESLFEGTRAQFGTNVGSANAEAGTTASVQYSQSNVLVWGGGSMRRTDDYATPAGAVENSASELTNARAGLGWFGDRFFASSGFTLEDGRYGVPFADEFHAAHGVQAAGETEIDIASRRRVGRFDMGLRNLANAVIEGVRVAVNVIDWNHDELEVQDGIENIGTRFTNRTYIMRADVDQRQTDRLSGRFGAWAQLRDFEAVGVEALAPRTDQTSFAAFAYEEVDFQRTRLQFGGRVEQNAYRTTDRIGAAHSHGIDAPDARDRQFLGASASVGLHTDVGAGSAFVANLTHSHRAPALEELYNFGPHVGNLAFEVGNTNLDAETTLGLDVSFRHQAGRVRSNLNAYVYSIDNFIFGDRTGEVQGSLPVWYFIQGDSRFVGVDARSSVRLGGNAWATLGIGYVDATLTTTGEPLPRIPPLRGTVSLDVPYGGFTFGPQLEFAGRQANVFRDETETNAYSVVNLRASYVWPRQHAAHILSFTGYNLTNELYRNHTSYIK